MPCFLHNGDLKVFREIVRLVECLEGESEIEMLFEPRPGYAREAVRMRQAGKLGLRVELRDGLLVLGASAA